LINAGQTEIEKQNPREGESLGFWPSLPLRLEFDLGESLKTQRQNRGGKEELKKYFSHLR
jgi:hypothetical protein